MDRNREARRATNMAAPPNGLSSSRRRHRTNSLRDSPDEDGGMEVQEAGRLRDRGLVKKERGDRDRDRERERERARSSRSKRRESRLTVHHRDDGDDMSEESVNDEEEDDDDAGNGGGLRMLPPPSANPSTSAAATTSNHHSHSHNHNQNPYSQQLQHRKSFPPNKMLRAAAPPPPAWKATDEMIGVSVPRKARSSSTKRSHEWTYGGAAVGGGGGMDQFSRQSSASPVRLGSTAASPAPVAPSSPSSSSVSARKKMKVNGGGSKPRPPKSSSKSSSSNPEELEIEIAEVLYGLMTQSQAPPKKEILSNEMKIDSNKSSSEAKSRVSSPISNPQNSTSFSTVAPKRKRPRQVSENPPFSVRNSPGSSSVKTETDHHLHQHQNQNHPSPKTDNSSPYLEDSSPASTVAAENGVSSFGFTTLPDPSPAVKEEGKCGVGVGEVLTKEEVEKDAHVVGLNDGKSNVEALTTTASTNLKTVIAETESQKQEKFEIDLMAPPPSQRTSQETDGDIESSNHKQMLTQPLQEMSKSKEDDKTMVSTDERKPKAGTIKETEEPSKQVNEDRKTELHFDFGTLNKDGPSTASVSSNKSLHQALKHQQLSTKSETQTAQPSSLQIPMPVPGWPPMGYVAPLQGVISMDGNTMPSTPIQPLFTQPKPKRCATHCYIARNIHYLQQFMKMNPFWQAASGPVAPMFSTKHGIPNVIPPIEPLSVQDKGQPVGIFPGQTTGKDTKPSQATTVPDSAHRKQPVLLQQAMPPVPPNNMLHGPAFIFPFNQQQAAAVATASARPGSSKLSNNATTSGLGGSSGAAGSASIGSSTATAAATALGFSYPNMGANETQYLAILPNHPYNTFPIPAAVGAPSNYRGNHPHPQTMPLFNGSFYSSQMIHPSQVSQVPQPPQQAPLSAQSQQTHQNSSGSTSSSHKHLQSQQRQHGSGAAAANGGGSGGSNINNYPSTHKSRSQQPSQPMNPPVQARHLENEVAGGEDSPSTADSRFSRGTMSGLGQSLNFAMMYPPAVTPNDKKPHQQTQQQQQQQGLKSNSNEKSFAMMYPQGAAMSFAPMNGTSMAQNHATFQGLPESVRQSYHHMMTTPSVLASASASASVHQSEQKKDFRMSEEPSRTTGHDSSNGEEDRKGSAGLPGTKSGQSIAFSRPDLGMEASPSLAGAMNLGSNNRSTRSPMSTTAPAAAQSSQHLQAQFQQQQQVLNHLIQQQNHIQNMNARSKSMQPSSNGTAYADHLKTSTSSMAAKFPNSLSSSPLQTSTTNSSPVQSPYWKHTVRPSTASQVSSSLASTTTSSLKNLHQTHQTHQPQQQSSRSHPQSHTQISFGAAAVTQKPQSTTSQPPSNSGGNNQSHSPPMLVGSPTTSLSSSQPPKTTVVGTQRSSSSILGNPPSSNSTKSQPQQLTHPVQLSKQAIQQQQQQQQQSLDRGRSRAQPAWAHPSHPYMQIQAQAHAHAQAHHLAQIQAREHAQAQQQSLGSTAGAASGYYIPRKQQQQPQQQQQMGHQQSSSSSTAMLSLCPPVTLANTTTSDPAEAIAAATSNLKGGAGLASQQGILHASQSSMSAGFPSYVHNASTAAAVQAKPAEQKQPAA